MLYPKSSSSRAYLRHVLWQLDGSNMTVSTRQADKYAEQLVSKYTLAAAETKISKQKEQVFTSLTSSSCQNKQSEQAQKAWEIQFKTLPL